MFVRASAFNQDYWEVGTRRRVTTYANYVLRASAFNQDIGSWNTAQVTDMQECLIRFCVQPRHFLVDWIRSDVGAKFYVYFAQLRFKRNLSAPTPTPDQRVRVRFQITINIISLLKTRASRKVT